MITGINKQYIEEETQQLMLKQRTRTKYRKEWNCSMLYKKILLLKNENLKKLWVKMIKRVVTSILVHGQWQDQFTGIEMKNC